MAENNLTVTGSDLNAARDIDLVGGHDVDIRAAKGLQSANFDSEHLSAAAGINFGANGIGVTASAAAGDNDLVDPGDSSYQIEHSQSPLEPGLQTEVAVTGTLSPDTTVEAAAKTFGDAKRYLDELAQSNPEAVKWVEIAIVGATGGPVKGAVSEVVDRGLNAVLGDEMAAAMDTVTDYAGAAVTNQDESVDEFAQDARRAGHEDDQGRIKDGTEFFIGTVLGIGVPGKKGQGDSAPRTMLQVSDQMRREIQVTLAQKMWSTALVMNTLALTIRIGPEKI